MLGSSQPVPVRGGATSSSRASSTVVFLAVLLGVLAVAFGGAAHRVADTAGLPGHLSAQVYSAANAESRGSLDSSASAHHHIREDAGPRENQLARVLRRFVRSRGGQKVNLRASWLISWLTLRHLRGSPSVSQGQRRTAWLRRRHIVLCIHRV